MSDFTKKFGGTLLSSLKDNAFAALDATLMGRATHKDELIAFKVYLRKKYFGFLYAQQNTMFPDVVDQRKKALKNIFESPNMRLFLDQAWKDALKTYSSLTPPDSGMKSGQALYQAELQSSIKSLDGTDVSSAEYVDITAFVTRVSWDISTSTASSGMSIEIQNPGHILYDNMGRLLVEARDELYVFVWDSYYETFVPVCGGVADQCSDNYGSGTYVVSVNCLTSFLYLQQARMNVRPSLSAVDNMFNWMPNNGVVARADGIETFCYNGFSNVDTKEDGGKEAKDTQSKILDAVTNFSTRLAGLDIASVAALLICGINYYAAKYISKRIGIGSWTNVYTVLGDAGYSKAEVDTILDSGVNSGVRDYVDTKGISSKYFDIVVPVSGATISTLSVKQMDLVAGLDGTMDYTLSGGTAPVDWTVVAKETGTTVSRLQLLNPSLIGVSKLPMRTVMKVDKKDSSTKVVGLGYELQTSSGTDYISRNMAAISKRQIEEANRHKLLNQFDTWKKSQKKAVGPAGNFSNSLIVEEDVEQDIGYQMIFSNDIPMYDATYSDRAQLIRELADKVGLYFWVDQQNNFRLETVHANDFPSTIIEDLDIESWGFSESTSEVVTRVDVIGESLYGMPYNEGDMRAAWAVTIDWDIFSRYGYISSGPITMPNLKVGDNKNENELEVGIANCIGYSRRLLGLRNSNVLQGELVTTCNPSIRPNTTVFVRKRNMIYLVTGVRGSVSPMGAGTVALSLGYGRMPGQFFKTLMYEYDERIEGNPEKQKVLLSFMASQRAGELKLFTNNRGPVYDYITKVVEPAEKQLAYDMLTASGGVYSASGNAKLEIEKNFIYLAGTSNYLRSRKSGASGGPYTKKLGA